MISVVGIGPGDPELLTDRVKKIISEADLLIGWKRALAQFSDGHCDTLEIGCNLDELLTFLKQNLQRNIVVLASGEPLLFGIGKRISEEIDAQYCCIESGVSSVQYFFSRIGLDMNDVYITSSHGKAPDYDLIARLPKVALVTDKVVGPYQIAKELIARGALFTMYVGENLSYPDECIEKYDLSQSHPLKNKRYPLNVVVLNNERQ